MDINESQEIDSSIDVLARQMENVLKANYFIGQYYFAVNTYKNRAAFGLTPGQEIDPATQKKMQSENVISLFHEYIHYIHEISTVLGNVYFAIDLSLKTIFSQYFDTAKTSCEHRGVDWSDTNPLFDIFKKLHISKEVLSGDALADTKILQIKSIRYLPEDVCMPHAGGVECVSILTPELTAELLANGQLKDKKLRFGKFFIYEGLAYELDREIERQVLGHSTIRDHQLRTEYTVLRLVANFIFPGIEKKAFLTFASLALSYINPGATFIQLLERAKETIKAGASMDSIIDQFKAENGQILIEKMDFFNGAQDEIIAIFTKRTQLYMAFSAICEQARGGYAARATHPAFEVDLVFSGQYAMLLDVIPICDYMYKFLDEDKYNRDFFGTASFSVEVSEAFKVLIGIDHYQKNHQLHSTVALEAKETVECPFYSCCNLPLRKTHEQTCATRPWRIFEISSHTDRQYCWYGQAVGEFKGPSER